MRAEDFSERIIDIDGWQCRLTTYKIGDVYYCKADNVSPGARLARGRGATKEEAELSALNRATELLNKTRRQTV